MNCISLLTDFGLKDWFVGNMRAVILRLHPRAVVIDLAHEIPSGNIRAGAFALAVSYRYFPQQTVHLAVVDPGVGSARRPLAIRTTNYFFVGPDNGILSWALAREKILAIHRLENPKYFLEPVSRTFHGRDIFAPVAAHLAKGVPISKFGPAVSRCQRLEWPEPVGRRNLIQGEVLYVDRFGNAMTNVANEMLKRGHWTVSLGRNKACPVGPYYQSVAPGKLVGVSGSSGYLEIAINGGHAANQLNLKIGSPIVLKSPGARR